ncbi:MAG: Gfo/Idh/MocA family oxidoreductase [Clostridia bacterium]|nr:Gfo/Idh/MocA family oxidoreductase [Clostridia bacterium]
MEKKVKNTDKAGCGIIGYGGMGGWHARHLAESDVGYLRGVWDIKPERNELAESQGIHAYKSEADLLADPDISVVTIATPNDVHAEIAIRALRAGKNVISEKPVTLNSKQLDAVIAASEETGKLFTVHQNRRWDCDFMMMREAFRRPEFGKIFRIESRIQGSRGIPGDWRAEKAHGGGMIYDWGVHLIDQMLCIAAGLKIESVFCVCENVIGAECDEGFRMDINFEGGFTGHIEVGTHNFISLPRFYLTGTCGSAVIDDWRDSTRCICVKDWNDGPVKPVVTAAGMTKTMAPRAEDSMLEFRIERPASDVHDFYRNFIAATRGEAEQIVTHAQMRRVMKVMETAFMSDRAKSVIPFVE